LERTALQVLLATTAILASQVLGADGRSSSGARLAGVDRQAISRFYESTGRPCEFRGQLGVVIRCRTFLHASRRGAIVIAAGYTENMRKYSETAFDLYQAGFSVFLYDHRGQGYSQRLLTNPTLGTIDEFAYFGDDLHQFVTTIVRKELKRTNQSPEHVYLLAHSLGGAIGALALEKYPGDFRAAVLSAPMLKLNLRGWNESAAQVFLDVQSLLGRDELPVTAPRDPSTIPFSENTVTHSEARFEFQRQVLTKEPGLKIFAPTHRWVRKAIAGSRAARKNGASIRSPILILQATQDSFVEAEGQREFCQAAARCKILEVQNARHEILQERDQVRDLALKTAIAFFDQAN
jgi:lysophospholipase